LEKARFESSVFFACTVDRLLRVFSLLYAPGSPAEKVSLLLLSDLIWQALRAIALYGMAKRLRVWQHERCARVFAMGEKREQDGFIKTTPAARGDGCRESGVYA